MSDSKLYGLDEIVESGLCTGCGLCRSVLGPEALYATDEADGLERPRARRPLTSDELAKLNAICPGVHVSVPQTDAAIPHDDMWGNIIRLTRGFASDPAVRFRSATGGALTALAIHLLETGEVDFIAHLAADPERPMMSKAQRSYTREEVIAASGSRYAATAPLVDIDAILNEGRPFAYVGKPCDVTALCNLARLDDRVDKLCRYKLTLVCGGFSELSKFQELLDEWAMREEDLARFSYRGYGCPGPTAAETKDGRRAETVYWKLWGDEASWRSFYRCKICPDAIGMSADIAALDVWDGGNATEEDDGWNGFIARTAAGAELLNAAVVAGAITLDEEWAVDNLERCQPHQSRKRRAVRARFSAMSEFGIPVPHTEDAGLDKISHAPGGEAYEKEKSGTLARLGRGGHRRD
jgi:coenzyme F420 hydrogenase subunit beta